MIKQTSLKRSLIIQLKVIGAVLKREFITRYGRYNIGFLWMFVDPMLFTAGVTLIHRFILHGSTRGAHIDPISFTLTGYGTVMLWRNAATRCLGAIGPNTGLLYHSNVQVFDLMAARLILEIAGGTVSLIVLMGFCITMGWINLPHDILTMAIAWLLLAWFSFAQGYVVGALSQVSDAFERVFHVYTYLYLPISGIFYMVEWLPMNIRKYALLLPTVNFTEMLRAGYYGNLVHSYYSVGYMVVVNIIVTLIGLWAIREAVRRMEPEW